MTSSYCGPSLPSIAEGARFPEVHSTAHSRTRPATGVSLLVTKLHNYPIAKLQNPYSTTHARMRRSSEAGASASSTTKPS